LFLRRWSEQKKNKKTRNASTTLQRSANIIYTYMYMCFGAGPQSQDLPSSAADCGALTFRVIKSDEDNFKLVSEAYLVQTHA